ncbi:MAG: PIN domain-containing protein [Candidatus Zixiibacteriota bacterium]
MSRLVFDTSVLIDIINADILEHLCQLDYELLISNVQVGEQKKRKEITCRDLESYGFKIISHPPDEVEKVYLIKRLHNRLSVKDLFAFITAEQEKALLITGDKDLRKMAEKSGLECHGILWLLDQIVDKNILSKKFAYRALSQIIKSGGYLPEKEVHKRLKEWSS